MGDDFALDGLRFHFGTGQVHTTQCHSSLWKDYAVTLVLVHISEFGLLNGEQCCGAGAGAGHLATEAVVHLQSFRVMSDQNLSGAALMALCMSLSKNGPIQPGRIP